MMGSKAAMTSQSYRQQKHISVESEQYKAARISASFVPDKPLALTELWENTLTTYCDYFIRY